MTAYDRHAKKSKTFTIYGCSLDEAVERMKSTFTPAVNEAVPSTRAAAQD